MDDGCRYYEFDVGVGRFDRGKRRFVMEVVAKSYRIRKTYLTDERCTKGRFVRDR